MNTSHDTSSFWARPAVDVLATLQTPIDGLAGDQATMRLTEMGPNQLRPRQRWSAIGLFLNQFKSPIILILLFAAVLSLFLHDALDAAIILIIIVISAGLGFWQEHGAANAVETLLAMVRVTATVLRDSKPVEVPLEEVIPGDVVVLHAGDSMPGDCLVLESKDLAVDESTLTGETYPVEKYAGVLPPDTPLAQRKNALFMGTHVVSGSAKALVARTGRDTEFGSISEHLRLRPPETEFEHGIRRFGYFLMEVTLVLVLAIFFINVLLRDPSHHPVLEVLMFSLALAVGLTPQLLPAIISVNLAHGARNMAEQKVIVRRLPAIENFGSMNVLCSDKTGTITEGLVQVHSAVGVEGQPSDKAFLYAYLNSSFETGFTNPIDKAIRAHRQLDLSAYCKLDEEPYDFIRKRLTILVAEGDRHFMTTKGALVNVLEVCESAEMQDGQTVSIEMARSAIQAQFEQLSSKGFRTLGVAFRDVKERSSIAKDDEREMTFVGLLVLFDPPKAGISQTIQELDSLGVSLKIITGDNLLVAAHLAEQVGFTQPKVLTGGDLRRLSDEALLGQVNNTHAFSEVEPNQKERIILALKKAGNVVGYMGDGINDVSALHAADVSISVNTAVDVAKEAADIVLLDRDLGVLAQGVREGRVTFANTLKYVFMATSANFGNMFSMAGASMFLPFLPLLPKQVLLTNLMTDFPEMTIASDSVDPESASRPHRWDIRFIRRFMITFGVLSSVFDFVTFGILLLILRASTEAFRTGWFVESVVSACLIVLVIRSRRPLGSSRPGRYLLTATLCVVTAAVALPFTPLAPVLGFCPLPGVFWLAIVLIIAAYVVSAEFVKRLFYRRVGS